MRNTNIPDRTTIPAFGDPILLEVAKPDEIKLDNGLSLYCIHASDEDVVRLDIVIKAGSAFQSKKLVASSVGRLLREGTQQYSASYIAEELDYLGAYFDVEVTKDTATLTLYSIAKHLPEILPVISDLLHNATFPEEEVKTHLDRQRQEFKINSEKVRYKAMLEFNRMVFGEDSAYGQIIELDDFDNLLRDDLVDYYQKKYTIGSSYVIASGNITDNVVALVNRHFGNGWNNSKDDQKNITFLGDNGQQEKFIHKEGAMQSAIRIGRRIVNRLHPDYNRFLLLSTILGGYFGSRLMSNLREDKGFTYGIHSFTTNYIHGATFSITTEVNAKSTLAAVDEIYKEMEKLRTSRVSRDELELVKNYIYGTFLRNFDGPFALAERFRSARDFGLGFDYYIKNLNNMLEITSGELLETANKYLLPEDMIKLVVGSIE